MKKLIVQSWGLSTIWVITIIIAALTIAGGIYWWQKSKLSSSTSLSPALSLTTSPLQQDQTAGWQTYLNNKYGFEIKYPGDYKMDTPSDNLQRIYNVKKRENSIEISIIGDFKTKNGQETFQELKLNSLAAFSVYIKNYVKTADLYAGATDGEKKLFSPQSIKFYGYEALILQDQNFKNTDFIFLYNNNLAFMIMGTAFPGYENMINQILSTFKFTK